MAYSTPATFVADDILTAAQLNTLSQAITELQSAGEQPGACFVQQVLDADGTIRAWMRHQHRYLWWRLDWSGGGIGDNLEIKIEPESSADQTLYANASPNLASYYEVEDLNGLLADGEFYTIVVNVAFDSPGTATLVYLQERSAAS